jgi:hypothetical protein
MDSEDNDGGLKFASLFLLVFCNFPKEFPEPPSPASIVLKVFLLHVEMKLPT